MGQYPLVSIRIPAYNHENFVVETLESALLDPYPNKEIVIIDDASVDSTWEKICNWAEDNKKKISIKFLKNDENLGVSKTVNRLHELCSGEYIVAIASDDVLLPGSIQTRLDFLKTSKKRVVFSDCIVIDSEGNEIYSSGLTGLYNVNKANLKNEALMKKELMLNWGVPGGTLMYHRSIIETIKFNENLIIEDLDLFLKWMAAGELGFIDEKLTKYRIHDSNVSNNESYQLRKFKDYIYTIFSNLKLFSFKYKIILIQAVVYRVYRKVKSML